MELIGKKKPLLRLARTRDQASRAGRARQLLLDARPDSSENPPCAIQAGNIRHPGSGATAQRRQTWPYLKGHFSDAEIDKMEREIPRLAAEATYAAFHRVLDAGLTVLISRGIDLIEVRSGKPDKIVEAVPLRRKVVADKVIKVRSIRERTDVSVKH